MHASTSNRYDVFISHASEDKDDFVDSLARALEVTGLKVWYDTNELQIGDSIREAIDQGLSESRYGVVVLSPAFFRKAWPQYELDGLAARDLESILPVWHNVTREDVLRFSPSLDGRYALSSSGHSVSEMARQIAAKVGQVESPAHHSQRESHQQSIPESGFAVFYIAPDGTPKLPLGDEPETPLFSILGNEDSWNRMLHDNEEVEYRIQDGVLRIRLDWAVSITVRKSLHELLPLAVFLSPCL